MTQQTPIGSGFGASTTAGEIIRDCDLSGKIAIVTAALPVSVATSNCLDDDLSPTGPKEIQTL